MRVTGPTRRRNQAWVGVRDRMGRLARRQVPVEEEEEEEGVESESSDSESDINGEESDMSDSDLEEDSDDEEETISPPGATPTAGVGAGVGVSLLPGSSATLTTSTRSTASPTPIDSSLGQQLTSVGVEPTPLPTLSSSPTAPVAGGAQSLDSSNAANQPQGETLGLTQDNTMNTGEAVGIVIGVLALIGLVIGGAFFWKKFRSDRGLPFLPPRLSNLSNRFSRKRDGADDMDEKLVPPTFPAAGNTKTNTKIMDELMQAAYDADNGNNNMEFFGAFGQDKKVPQLPQSQAAPFMDEKAYIALAGQLTPRTPKKPVSQWLSAVQTPRQSQGPKFPPSPMLPPDAYVPPIRNNPNAIPGTIAGPRVQPPKAMTVRDTMTTNTTNTSVRWYG